jgi:uncharacterized ferritin-like protein (DUF455 family)
MVDSFTRALDILAATPVTLEAIVQIVPPNELRRRPQAATWSVWDVLNHLLHVETAVINKRIHVMVEQTNPHLPPAPQTPDFPDSLPELLVQWKQARTDNLTFLRLLTPEQLQRTGKHQRYGDISVHQHVVEWAYHDLDHLHQILTLHQIFLYEHIGPFQALYPQPV